MFETFLFCFKLIFAKWQYYQNIGRLGLLMGPRADDLLCRACFPKSAIVVVRRLSCITVYVAPSQIKQRHSTPGAAEVVHWLNSAMRNTFLFLLDQAPRCGNRRMTRSRSLSLRGSFEKQSDSDLTDKHTHTFRANRQANSHTFRPNRQASKLFETVAQLAFWKTTICDSGPDNLWVAVAF